MYRRMALNDIIVNNENWTDKRDLGTLAEKEIRTALKHAFSWWNVISQNQYQSVSITNNVFIFMIEEFQPLKYSLKLSFYNFKKEKSCVNRIYIVRFSLPIYAIYYIHEMKIRQCTVISKNHFIIYKVHLFVRSFK